MSITMIATHFALALALFFLVNWIGRHAVDFGYASVTLFDAPNETVALNFFVRVAAPTIFIIALSAIVVAIGRPGLRFDIQWVAIHYYALRFGAIWLLNQHRLVSWPRFALHAGVGIGLAVLAYRELIVPNRSLLPNLETAGNELWLAILAFLYAVGNNVPLPTGPSVRRRNAFVQRNFNDAQSRFDSMIEGKLSDDRLRLIAYAVLVYEDFCRPPAIRAVERWMWWRTHRTTGIMQVSDQRALSDVESVDRGTSCLDIAWTAAATEPTEFARAHATIAAYNRDQVYISRVFDIMEMIAKRAAPRFEPAYQRIFR